MSLKKKCLPALKRVMQAMSAIPKSDSPADQARQAKLILGEYGKPKPSASDILISYQVNSLLSGPQTALANIVSIPVQGVLTPLNQVIAATFKKMRGQDASVFDVLMGFNNLLDNFSASLKMSKEGWLRGFPLDVNSTVDMMAYSMKSTKAEASKALDDFILAERARVAARESGKDPKQVLQQMRESGVRTTDEERKLYLNDNFDYFRRVFTGPLSFIEVPTRLTVGIDEFGKSFFRLYGVQQQISQKARKVASETGQDFWPVYNSMRRDVLQEATGTDAKKNLANLQKSMGKLFGEGEKDMMPYESLREFAASKLFQQALTGKPRAVQKLMQDSPVMRLFIPFMKTPWNIVKEGVSYTPAGPLAKAALRQKYDNEGNPILTKRGAYYELDWDQMAARQIVGGAAFLGLASAFDADNITGSPRTSQERQQWRDEGKPEQSIKIGDTWYGYGRVEPVATVIQMYAELTRTMADFDAAESRGQKMSLEEKGKEIMKGLKAAVMDKTFLEGMSDMVSAVGEGKFQNVLPTIARQAVPTLVSNVARTMDGQERQVSGDTLERTIGAVQQRVPIWRDQLPEEYGLYGDARKNDPIRTWTGFAMSDDESRTELQKAMDTYGVDKVRPNDKLRNIGMTQEQLADYRKLTAEILTPRLERFIQSSTYQNASAGERRVYLKKVVDKLKRQAGKQYFADLMRSDPAFARKFYINELVKKGQDEAAAQMSGQ